MPLVWVDPKLYTSARPGLPCCVRSCRAVTPLCMQLLVLLLLVELDQQGCGVARGSFSWFLGQRETDPRFKVPKFSWLSADWALSKGSPSQPMKILMRGASPWSFKTSGMFFWRSPCSTQMLLFPTRTGESAACWLNWTSFQCGNKSKLCLGGDSKLFDWLLKGLHDPE